MVAAKEWTAHDRAEEGLVGWNQTTMDTLVVAREDPMDGKRFRHSWKALALKSSYDQ